MDAVPCPPLALPSPHAGLQPHSRAVRDGGHQARLQSSSPRAAAGLPASTACSWREVRRLPRFTGQPPPAGLIAVQGVRRSLPCCCRSLESLLIPGHPAWPCGQVVITRAASRASSPGIAPRCPASRVGNPASPAPGPSSLLLPLPGLLGIVFIPETDNQRKTSHRRPGLTLWWGQVGCSGVQLGDVLGQRGARREGKVTGTQGLSPTQPLAGTPPCPPQAPGPSGGRWLAQHARLPAESRLWGNCVQPRL